MALPKPNFTCFTAQKVVVFGDREEILKEQKSKLESYLRGCEGDSVVLSGGCMNASPGILGHGSGYVAAFTGSLNNYSQLIKQLTSENKDTNTSAPSQSLCAELVCDLYKLYGRIVPQKLRGDYSFVLYDSGQGRVLAAASHSSHRPLLQARGPDGCLIITTEDADSLPDGSALITAIGPGHMKYGWSSDPQPFADPRIAAELKNIKIGRSPKKLTSMNSDLTPSSVERSAVSLPERKSMGEESLGQASLEPQSPAMKKTRRGKRAGKNQKLRAELMARLNSDVSRGSLELNRNSLEFSRNSFDQSRGSMEFAPVTPSSSLSSRADGQSWWRTDTPRSSFEVRSLPTSGMMRPLLSNFSRNSMSANASPFVPAAFTAQQPINIVRAPSNPPLVSPGSGRLQSRTESQDLSFSRVILKNSMSGQLSGKFSPFQDLPELPSGGKADAAWNEGESCPYIPYPPESPPSVPPTIDEEHTSEQTSELHKRRGVRSSQTGLENEAKPAEAEAKSRSSAINIPSAQSKNQRGSIDEQRVSNVEQQSRSSGEEMHQKFVRRSVAARNDSAHEDTPSSDSDQTHKSRKTASIDSATARNQASAFTEHSARPGSNSGSDREVTGSSPLRGTSPNRPPRHPGGVGIKQMLRSLMHRRPSHAADLDAEVDKESEQAQKFAAQGDSWARSASHGALVDLDGPTGLWDAPGLKKAQSTSHPTSSTRGGGGSLSSQKSLEKLNQKSHKNSPHGSHHNLAWLARQTRSIFSKSKSCNDLKEMGSTSTPPHISAGGR